MQYKEIKEGIFIKRPNRFIAHVIIDGVLEICHVKNTGRCGELLVPNAIVYVEHSENPNRKTKYSLICVKKGNRLINMDSQAPNKVVEEWLRSDHASKYFENIRYIKPEKTYKNSRFDFYVETEMDCYFIEVKGVTLEEKGIVRFPDAPSKRAVRHVEELCEALQEGYKSVVIFVIQMDGVLYFEPNIATGMEFFKALQKANKEGVKILAFDSLVTPNTLILNKEIEVRVGVG